MYESRFLNWFYAIGARLSRPKFLRFAEFVLNALRRDPARWAALIALLEPLVARFADTLEDRLGGEGKGLTTQFSTHVRTLNDFIRLVMRKKVLPEYEKGSAGYQRYLPQGISEYLRAGVPQYPVLFSRFVAAMEKEPDLVGADLLKQAQDHRQALNSLFEQRDQHEATTDAQSATLDDDEREICDVLLHIYGTLLSTFYRNLPQARAFFDFDMLATAQQDDDDIDEAPASPTPGA